MENSLDVSIWTPLLSETVNTIDTNVCDPEVEDIELASNLKQLKRDIEAEYFPTIIETPFPPRCVRLKTDCNSYMLVSSQGKICSISETNPQNPHEIDTSAITRNEIRHAVLISDNEIIIAESSENFYRVNLQRDLTAAQQIDSENFRGTYRLRDQNSQETEPPIIKTLKVINNTLYLFESQYLRTYHLEDNTRNKKTIETEEPFLTMDIKEDGDEFVIALTTKVPNVLVYDLNADKDIITIPLGDFSYSVKITKNFLACAYNKETKLWNWGTWEEVRTIKSHIASFNCIDINSSETLLAGALSNGNIAVWSLSSPSLLPQIFTGSSGPMHGVEFKTDSCVVCFSQNESKLYLREIGDFPQKYSKRIDKGKVKSIHYLQDLDRILLNIQDKGLVAYSSENLDWLIDDQEERDMNISLDDEEEKEDMNISIKDKEVKIDMNISLNDDQTKIFRICNDQRDKSTYNAIIDPVSLELLDEKCFTNNSLTWWISTHTTRKGYSQIVKAYSNGELAVNTFELEIVKGSTVHNCIPTVLASFSTGVAVVSGDEEGNVIIYNLIDYVRQGVFKKHAGAICAIEISKDDSLVVCASKDGVIRISDVRTRACIISMKGLNSSFTKLYLTENMQYLLGTCEENYFCIWDFQTKAMIARKDGYNNFLVYKNETRLCLVSSDEITTIENPLTSTRLHALGNSQDNLDFFGYIRSFLKNKTVRYKAMYNNHLITPYFFNALHLYANSNCAKHLKQSLSADSFLVRSEFEHTALSICVASKSSLMNDLIDHLLKKIEKNKDLSIFFQDQLVKINQIGSEHLKSIYIALFKQLKLKQLPDFYSECVELPILKMTERTYDLQVDEFFDRNLNALDKPIDFSQFLVKLNLKVGSSDGIEFLESLVESPNEEIFRTPFIQLLLNKKWNKVQWIMSIQGFVYYLYLIMLIVYISYWHTDECLLVTLVISCLLTAYEMWQMLTMKLEYFKSLINIVDILRAVCFIAYSILCFVGEKDEYKDPLIVSIVLLSFVRGITFFNLFGPTRYMAYLIGQVFKDMVAFAIVLFYSIISIAVLYMSLKSDKGEMDVFEMLFNFYTLTLGEFSLEDFNIFEKVIFTVATILNTIVMLNLLISIIGDTYRRVQGNLEQADKKTIADMIIEVEKLFICNRNEGQKMHFTTCEEEGGIQIEEPLEVKNQGITDKVDETNKLAKETNKLTKETNKLVKEKYELIEKIVKEENELTRKMLMDEIKELKR